MTDLAATIAEAAAVHAFSGAIAVHEHGREVASGAFGFANRSEQIPNRVDTRFAIASGVKGITALTVMSLAVDGVIDLDVPIRAWLRDDLPLIDDAVTARMLLSHRSGIGDFLDEDLDGEITDYVLSVPIHRLVETEDFLLVLDGFPTKFAPDTDFSYCNGGFVVLALIAERVAGTPFAELVRTRVTDPAGMTQTAFLRSDELPAGTALGYLTLDRPRTNVHHLSVVGTGDGGIYTTVGDVARLWDALYAGRIVPAAKVAEMTTPTTLRTPDESYGLGFWIRAESGVINLEGYDAGVSFRSLYDPARALVLTVVANWSDGAWNVLNDLEPALGL